MSDAKAKAEARRAKIMARSSNMVSVVTSDETDETLYNTLVNTEVKVKERPLAARRRMVSQKESDVGTSSTPSTPTPAAKDDSPESPNKSTDEAENTENIASNKKEEAAPSSSTAESESSVSSEVQKDTATADSPTPKKIHYEPAKTLEQIEQEVAERTAQFDKSIKNVKKKPASTAAGAKSAVALKVKPFAIDPSNVMRVIRLIMIVFLGAFSAFRAVQNSRNEAVLVRTATISTPQVLDTSTEFVFDSPSTTTFESVAAPAETKTRTWVEYFQQRITRQAECSVTAVGLVWWLARFFSTAVHSQFKQQPKPTKPLDMVMNFLTNGVNSVLESVYSGIGEVSLHLFVLVVSATLFTAYFSSTIVDSSESLSAVAAGSEL